MKLRLAALALIGALALIAPPRAQADFDNGWHQDRPIVARIAASWPYNLRLGDGRHVDLHRGTLINPTGLTLTSGMLVRIWGHPDGEGDFIADRIDLLRGQGGRRNRDGDGG
ncbi:MAG TPA: hypothetical protein VMV73_00980 [Candidatus Dormibacteraeota bacterium]|nr:hypothetical protein [Candidatus Dormibacteraeota bacterium]